MEARQSAQNEIIQFIRQKDYRLVKELGQGACGKTVLLHDDLIGEAFVCKKYVPYDEGRRPTLFSNFVNEIKLLHRLHHPNVVRVFNYYLYPDSFAGYILMEFVDGSDIATYIANAPEQINELFLQAIEGFAYLERAGILHRDIRPGNLLVNQLGELKIIDLGFGKQINTSLDFQKSITLNWWCQPPEDFKDHRYDFKTEVYFVGKLFESLIQENEIAEFKYTSILREMCEQNGAPRIENFATIDQKIHNDRFVEIDFGQQEIASYRDFADAICSQITKIDANATYQADIGKIQTLLAEAYRNVMLEEFVPDARTVLGCFLAGYYYRKTGLQTRYVRDFLHLLRSSSTEQNRIIIANLHRRLDAITRYHINITDDDIPF